MRIESTTVENHRFGVARRRGYDAAEVDAVMSRVADTLAQYERMIKRTGRPDRSEITKSVVEAQESKNKLLAETQAAAAQVIGAATDEATAIRQEATITADRIIGAADDHLAAATLDAQRIREEADSFIDLAASRADELRSQADVILTSAIAEAEKVREQAEVDRVAQAADSEKMLHLAQAESNRLGAEAAANAEQARSNADTEVADILAQARQQAEAMINSAVEETKLIRIRVDAELDELRVSRERQADEVVATARNQSAEIRAAAAATAEAVAAQGRANAEEALAMARSQALDRLSTAQHEAEEALDQASRESESLMAAAREDNRRLERRVQRLRDAVVDFEAHIANLAEVASDRTGLIADMIEQEVAGTTSHVAEPESGAPAIGPRKKRSKAPAGQQTAKYPEPDGSGQLPAQRSANDGAHAGGSEHSGQHSVSSTGDAEPEGFVYDGGLDPASLSHGPGSHEGNGEDDEATTSTIYQRRGAGLKRRVAANKTGDVEPTD